MLRHVLIVLGVSLASLAQAQDRSGRDTPGEWVITHHTPFGLWDSMCDERATDGVLEQRCYLRYVEVFSRRPNFAAQFIFVTRYDGDRVEFGVEPGTVFNEDGFRIEREGATAWEMTDFDCLNGRECALEGDAAGALLRLMAEGGAFHFEFIDRHGVPQELVWSLSQFGAALEDLGAESASRGL